MNSNQHMHKSSPVLAVLSAMALLLFTLSSQAAEQGVDYQAELPVAPTVGEQGYFQPPGFDSLKDNEFGAAVKRGRNYFVHTQKYAREYVGNGMNCSNCHLNDGRRANSAPMWAAWTVYPKYRKKNDKVNTMEERIQGCFTYSMNAQGSEKGHPPESGSALLSDMQAYMFWMATGVPTGKRLAGAGYPKLDKPAQGYDPARGKLVYDNQCAICHGANGGGTKQDGQYVFPPLWGADSYNWGAGMHRVNTAAGFIKANMPLGKAYSLSDQEAWDVAAYINSHERPADPRDQGDIKATAERFHKHAGYYGKEVDGKKLGEGTK